MDSLGTTGAARPQGLVPGVDDPALLTEDLLRLAAEHDLVLVPLGLENIGMVPTVQLGQRLSHHDLGEFVEMMVGLGARGLHLVDGLRLIGTQGMWLPGDPPTFTVQCLVGGVLYSWTPRGLRPRR